MENQNIIDFDENALAAFTRHKLDVERGFEKEDPSVNITSIDELALDD